MPLPVDMRAEHGENRKKRTRAYGFHISDALSCRSEGMYRRAPKIFRRSVRKMCPSTLPLDVLEAFGRSVHFSMARLTFTGDGTRRG